MIQSPSSPRDLLNTEVLNILLNDSQFILFAKVYYGIQKHKLTCMHSTLYNQKKKRKNVCTWVPVEHLKLKHKQKCTVDVKENLLQLLLIFLFIFILFIFFFFIFCLCCTRHNSEL